MQDSAADKVCRKNEFFFLSGAVQLTCLGHLLKMVIKRGICPIVLSVLVGSCGISFAVDAGELVGSIEKKEAGMEGAVVKRGNFPVSIDNFDKQSVGEFPDGWHIMSIEVFKTEQYKVAEEKGQKFLRARYSKPPTTIIKRFRYEVKDFPYFSWRWRAHELPKGGNEMREEANDAAAGVYVYFQTKSGTAYIIKYTWSSSLQPGTIAKNPKWEEDFQTWTHVMKSGTKKIGQWEKEKINVYEDFVRIFKSKTPPPVIGIGILTDADSTASTARADYDDFKVSPK